MLLPMPLIWQRAYFNWPWLIPLFSWQYSERFECRVGHVLADADVTMLCAKQPNTGLRRVRLVGRGALAGAKQKPC